MHQHAWGMTPPAPRGRNRRHGRAIRSSVRGPLVPSENERIARFETTVATMADFLRSAWPDELRDVRFHVASMPSESLSTEHVDRWSVQREQRRIIIFRIPIQRLSRLHLNDELHQRMAIESCVFRAVAEYVGHDPWDFWRLTRR